MSSAGKRFAPEVAVHAPAASAPRAAATVSPLQPSRSGRRRRLPPGPVLVRTLWRAIGVPAVAFAIFLVLWSRLSAGIETSLGQIPGPAALRTFCRSKNAAAFARSAR